MKRPVITLFTGENGPVSSMNKTFGVKPNHSKYAESYYRGIEGDIFIPANLKMT
jgi:hypothetical protein